MGDQKGHDGENLLRGLADFIQEGHAHGEEGERLDDDIHAAGIDPQVFVTKVHAFLDDAVKARRQAIHADRLSVTARLEALSKKWQERAKRWTAQDEKTFVARLDPRLAGAYFRNFKSAAPTDKASMIEDLELLEKLEELEKGEEGQA